MKFEIKTEIRMPKVGKMIYEHEQEFADGCNVFARVSEYREHIYKTFPGCDYALISAKQITERELQ